MGTIFDKALERYTTSDVDQFTKGQHSCGEGDSDYFNADSDPGELSQYGSMRIHNTGEKKHCGFRSGTFGQVQIQILNNYAGSGSDPFPKKICKNFSNFLQNGRLRLPYILVLTGTCLLRKIFKMLKKSFSCLIM